MRDAAVVGGVLGVGCVIVFALAAAVSMVFPNGTVVSANPWGAKGGVFMDVPVAVPEPMPLQVPAAIESPADGAEGAEK